MREDLALRLERFKEQWSVDAAAQGRVARPMVKFIGEEVLDTAVAVLHSVLDYRRLIDVPGYECIPLHPATRFIATMNYGYAGTRELNEALVSRFTVIRMPTLDEAQLCELLRADVPAAAEENIRRCVGLFLDLNAKAVNGEISTNSVDLRGMIAALRLMTDGMAPNEAIAVNITNKCFDEYEYALVRDVVMTRFAQ